MDCPVPLWVLKLGLERRRCDTVEPITHSGMVDTLRALLGEGASAAGVQPSAKDALLASGSDDPRLETPTRGKLG